MYLLCNSDTVFRQNKNIHSECHYLSFDITHKRKVRPRTGHDVPKEQYMYSSNLSLTSALARGGWLTPRPDFTPEIAPVPIV
jgi:hypothetical protein